MLLTQWDGSLPDTVAIVNLLKSVKNPIITVAIGACVSAAAMIFSCGQHRYIGEDIEYMIHQPYTPGNICNLNHAITTDLQAVYKKDLSIYIRHITSNGASIPAEKLEKVTKDGKDLYLTTSECKKYNIATHIFKSFNTLYKNEKISEEERIISYDLLDDGNDTIEEGE